MFDCYSSIDCTLMWAANVFLAIAFLFWLALVVLIVRKPK